MYFFQGEITGKELDTETGYYYFGARYLDPKTSRWISVDPAMGDYIPSPPVNDEAKKRNGNLPGQGGVFNYVNLHVYHYAGNNPVKYTDPDGRKDNVPQYISEAAKIVESQPGAGMPIFGAIAMWGGWGLIGAFLMSLQGDSIKPILPPNYEYHNGQVYAPDGTVIATIDQAFKHAEGSSTWNIVDGWSAVSYDNANDSLVAHFDKHGAEVGAKTVQQYLDKAKAFASNLKGTRSYAVPGTTDNVTRYIKNGKYVDLDSKNNIVSYGSVDHVE